MAATSQPLVTQIAVDVLKKGGSAVDAAIAANAALGLMEPTGSGIGGDFFVIVWDPKTRKLHGLNASGRAPMGQTLQQLRKANNDRRELPAHSWLSVTIPGAVDGWFALHGRFGKLPMKDVLAPAIAYAEDGFPITEVIAKGLLANVAGFEKSFKAGDLEEIANMRRIYVPNGARAEGRRDLQKPRSGAHLPRHRRRRARRLLFGPAHRRHGGLFQEDRRTAPKVGLPAPAQRVGRAYLDQLSRLRRLGAAAQRPGHRGAADAEHPRSDSTSRRWAALSRLLHCHDRGQEARL